jgi:hypothetical protein
MEKIGYALASCLFCAIYYVLLYSNFQQCQENFEVASNAYKEALEMAATKKCCILFPFYMFIFFCYMYGTWILLDKLFNIESLILRGKL